jgi:hypothetical protein
MAHQRAALSLLSPLGPACLPSLPFPSPRSSGQAQTLHKQTQEAQPTPSPTPRPPTDDDDDDFKTRSRPARIHPTPLSSHFSPLPSRSSLLARSPRCYHGSTVSFPTPSLHTWCLLLARAIHECECTPQTVVPTLTLLQSLALAQSRRKQGRDQARIQRRDCALAHPSPSLKPAQRCLSCRRECAWSPACRHHGRDRCPAACAESPAGSAPARHRKSASRRRVCSITTSPTSSTRAVVFGSGECRSAGLCDETR